MKRLLIVSVLLAMAGITVSQSVSAQNNVTRQLNAIPAFSVISLSGAPDVEYRQSTDGRTSVSVSGPKNMIDDLEVSVGDGILYVNLRNNYHRNPTIWDDDQVKVIASSPSLTGAWALGSGNIEILGGLTSDKVEMHMAGSGSIYCDRMESKEVRLGVGGSGRIEIAEMDCTSVLAVVDGSGDISIEGKADHASYLIGGSGDISAQNMTAQYLFAHVNGTGNISCDARQSIVGYVMGTGRIYFTGNPAHTNIAGTGSKEYIRQR